MMLAGPITFFHLQALPVVIIYAIVFFILGLMVGWFLWHEQTREAERMRHDLEEADALPPERVKRRRKSDTSSTSGRSKTSSRSKGRRRSKS